MMNLVEAARSGTQEAIEDLIRAVWPDAFRIALSITGDRHLAEDASQEACAILFRSISRLRSADAFKVWFFKIVMREARRLRRKNIADECSGDGALPNDLARAIIHLDLQSALAKLPAQQQTAIVLHFYAELNSREIAELLGIPDSTVRFHLMRARQALHI
ncbi:MAG: sigma-70 family RNA polymerase sigma factor, partial [Candidatus Eremiobacteraeota bacterium]|nr:sigma-70 family RNA polymerase sigma factor [Candidatus Eremiobacteraeota bacterium]